MVPVLSLHPRRPDLTRSPLFDWTLVLLGALLAYLLWPGSPR